MSSVYLLQYNQKTTKDKIIWILLNGPKSLKQVHHELSYRYNQNITNQAVFQTLIELKELNIVQKNNREYYLSELWVKDVLIFSDILRKQILEKKNIVLIDKYTTEITINSYIELGDFLVEYLTNETPIVLTLNHLWFPYLRREKRELIQKCITDSLIFVSSNSFVDRLLAIFYKKFARVKLNNKHTDGFETILTNKVVIKIFLPQELKNNLDAIYRAKKLFSINILDKFSEIIHQQHKIKILIIKDKDIAHELITKYQM